MHQENTQAVGETENSVAGRRGANTRLAVQRAEHGQRVALAQRRRDVAANLTGEHQVLQVRRQNALPIVQRSALRRAIQRSLVARGVLHGVMVMTVAVMEVVLVVVMAVVVVVVVVHIVVVVVMVTLVVTMLVLVLMLVRLRMEGVCPRVLSRRPALHITVVLRRHSRGHRTRDHC